MHMAGERKHKHHITVLISDELWSWFQFSVGWIPGRVGRVLRGQLYRLFMRCEGPMSISEWTDIRHRSELRVGRRVSMAQGCVLICSGGLTIGSDVMMAPGVHIVTNGHVFDRTDIPMRAQGIFEKPVTIGDDVWLSANVIVLPGVTVGRGSVIAAGSIVTKDVPEYSIVGGVPARVIRSRLPAKGEA